MKILIWSLIIIACTSVLLIAHLFYAIVLLERDKAKRRDEPPISH